MNYPMKSLLPSVLQSSNRVFLALRSLAVLPVLVLLLSGPEGTAQKSTEQGRFPVPEQGEKPVNDYAGVLEPRQKRALNEELVNYADTTSTQIVVVIMETLSGEDPNLYAAELGQQWGVGKQGQDNGLVMLIAMEEKKIAIQNGYGLEEYLTDAKTKMIIENDILPLFRQGDFYGGIQKGTNQVIAILEGNFEGSGGGGASSSDGLARYFPILFIGLIMVYMVFRRRQRHHRGPGSHHRHGGGIWLGGMAMGGGLGGGRGGGFGGGGGGFSGGFGGGGFGGGGASGGW